MTHVLRFLSADAYKDIDKYVLDAAADRGTRIHEACEAYDLYGELPDYEEDYDIYNYVVAYAAFCADYQPMWIAIEEPITDGEVAGTVDRIGKVKGDPYHVVVDIKTSSKIHEASVSAQTYKYAKIYNRRYDDELILDLYCLHLKADGTYEFRPLNCDKGLFIWNACYELHKLLEVCK